MVLKTLPFNQTCTVTSTSNPHGLTHSNSILHDKVSSNEINTKNCNKNNDL